MRKYKVTIFVESDREGSDLEEDLRFVVEDLSNRPDDLCYLDHSVHYPVLVEEVQ